MAGPVFSDQPGAIDGKGDIEVLQGNIVNQLVITALQKRRIDSDNRFQPIASHACCQGHRVLLSDGNVVELLWEPLGEFDHTRTLAHCRGDAGQQWIALRHVA